MTLRKKVLILGASGRDYHNFNMFFRNNANYNVIGFTHTQLPTKTSRYPYPLSGKYYKKGVPVYNENKLEYLIKKYNVDYVCFSYSDVSNEHVMELASKFGIKIIKGLEEIKEYLA